MASDRIKRQIERLLDQVEEAVDQSDWQLVRQIADNILILDPTHVDAQSYRISAERALGPRQPGVPTESFPEPGHEVPDTFSTPVENPSPTPGYLPREELIEPPPIIAEAPAETFTQRRVRVVSDRLTDSNAISNERTRAVGPIEAITRAFTHCFDWQGRASRSEFWWFCLFFIVAHMFVVNAIFYLVGILGDNVSYYPHERYWYLYVVEGLALFTPFSFLIVRRLRDANRSILYALLVVLGWLWWLGWFGWLGWFNGFFDNPVIQSFLGLGNAIFLFGCLPLCAMPSHSGVPAWSPGGIWKGAGLFILRAVIGIAILVGLIAVRYTIGYPNRGVWSETLTETMIAAVLHDFLFYMILLLPLVPIVMLQSRFEGRSVLEPFRPDK